MPTSGYPSLCATLAIARITSYNVCYTKLLRIGMTKEDLENNLGTIAKSGSLSFKKENDLGEDVNIIGQFGVGFYSAFMVSKLVTVTTKAYGSNVAYKWESEGIDGYSIEEAQKNSFGTEIVLHIMENSEDEQYDEFLEQYT